VIKRQVASEHATWWQAAQSRAMPQALWDDVELRIAVERQQSFQMLIGLHYPEHRTLLCGTIS